MKKYKVENYTQTWWAEYQTDGMLATDNQKILGIRSMSVGGTINHTDLDSTMVALGLPNQVGTGLTEVDLKAICVAKNLKLTLFYEQATASVKYAGLVVQTTPTFSPVAGAVAIGDTITISSASSSAIYYTLDGTIPTTASPRQSVTPAVVAALPFTLKAIAVRTGYYQSNVGSAAYTQAASANLSGLVVSGSITGYTFAAGTYTYTGAAVLNAVASVTVTPTGQGVITVNGVEVTSGQASDPIALVAGVAQTITIVATETGKSPKTYTVGITRNAGVVGTPVLTPAAGAITWGDTIAITSANANAIYYTIDGSTPTAAKTLYEAPVAVSSAITMKAIGITAGWDNSAVKTEAYTQLAATVPASITLAVGGATPVGGVTNVAIPNAGATDNTGKIIGWVDGTANKIKFTVTDDTGTSTITIGGAAYVSGADYAVAAAGSPITIVVTTTEEGKSTCVRTFTVDVTAL